MTQLPTNPFIRQVELLKFLPFSYATLWRNIKKGVFPKPVKLSERVNAWRVEEIQAWLDKQA